MIASTLLNAMFAPNSSQHSAVEIRQHLMAVLQTICFQKRAPLFRPVKADKTTPQYLWSFFCDDAAFLERKVLSKRALEVGNCPRHEVLRFKSGQLRWNPHKNLWFKRRNPGSKKPGNGWCVWLCARRIYTGNSLWSEWRDLNPRPHGPEPCALPTALHPDVQHGYYKDFSARCQEPTHSFFFFASLVPWFWVYTDFQLLSMYTIDCSPNFVCCLPVYFTFVL